MKYMSKSMHPCVIQLCDLIWYVNLFVFNFIENKSIIMHVLRITFIKAFKSTPSLNWKPKYLDDIPI